MKGHVFRPALFPGGERGARGADRGRAEDGEFLEHVPDVAVRFQQLANRLPGALAVAALVIEELDDGHVALGIAADRRCGVVIEIAVFEKKRVLLAFSFRRLLPVLEGPEGFDHHLGMGLQVVLDHLLHGLYLGRAQIRGVIVGGRRKDHGGGDHERERDA